MNWQIVSRDIPEFINAGLLTLRLGSLGILFSLVFGLLFAIFKHFKIPVLSQIITAYIEFARNTPLLIQLFFIYFGLPKIDIKLSGDVSCVIGLAFLGGAYMAEAFRAGFSSIKHDQIEGALSLALKKRQIFIYIILPQSFKNSISGILANFIFLLKETSMFGAIGVADLTFVAKDLIGLYYNTSESLFLLVISYLIILLPVVIVYYIVINALKRKVVS